MSLEMSHSRSFMQVAIVSRRQSSQEGARQEPQNTNEEDMAFEEEEWNERWQSGKKLQHILMAEEAHGDSYCLETGKGAKSNFQAEFDQLIEEIDTRGIEPETRKGSRPKYG